jgi:hypothetical protein
LQIKEEEDDIEEEEEERGFICDRKRTNAQPGTSPLTRVEERSHPGSGKAELGGEGGG